MQEDVKKLEQQLNKITAAGSERDESLDAENASLRECWLELGRLIEATQDSLPGPSVLKYPADESSLRHRTWSWSRSWLKPAVAIAATAVSLLAVIVGLALLKDRANIIKERPAIAQKIAQADNSSPSASAAAQSPAQATDQNEQKSNTTDNDLLAWDSSLDTEIAAVGDEILRIQADSYASNGTTTAIYYRMQLMQQELDENTL